MIADVSSASNLVEEALAMMMIRFLLRRDGCKLPVYPFRSGGGIRHFLDKYFSVEFVDNCGIFFGYSRF